MDEAGSTGRIDDVGDLNYQPATPYNSVEMMHEYLKRAQQRLDDNGLSEWAEDSISNFISNSSEMKTADMYDEYQPKYDGNFPISHAIDHSNEYDKKIKEEKVNIDQWMRQLPKNQRDYLKTLDESIVRSTYREENWR